MEKENLSKVTYEPLTLEKLEEFWKEFASRPPRKPVHELTAFSYSTLTDEEFKGLVKWASKNDIPFIGGQKGVSEFVERCKKLGIKLN